MYQKDKTEQGALKSFRSSEECTNVPPRVLRGQEIIDNLNKDLYLKG